MTSHLLDGNLSRAWEVILVTTLSLCLLLVFIVDVCSSIFSGPETVIRFLHLFFLKLLSLQ